MARALEHKPQIFVPVPGQKCSQLPGNHVDTFVFAKGVPEDTFGIGYLLRQDTREEGGGSCVTLPVSKAIVASRLNVTPEHFSRILHELVAAGMIAVEGRDVRILDPERLRNYHG